VTSIVFIEERDDGEEVEHVLPARWEICDRCEGDGHHVNPSIDGNGLTAEDFEDEDFREGYFGGRYDVRCFTCSGSGKVLVVDAERADKRLLEAYERQQAARARWDAEDRATRRMESGGRE